MRENSPMESHRAKDNKGAAWEAVGTVFPEGYGWTFWEETGEHKDTCLNDWKILHAGIFIHIFVTWKWSFDISAKFSIDDYDQMSIHYRYVHIPLSFINTALWVKKKKII